MHTRSIIREARPWGAILIVSLLGACATRYAPEGLARGASVEQATAALGAPTGRYARESGGERLEFARGPRGKHTYMLDFDAQGRLLGWQQVLTEQNFEAVRAGASRDQVLFALGHPSEVRNLPRQRQMLWSYRYESPFCSWFQVSIDAQDRVAETGYGPDPACEINVEKDMR